MKKEIDILHIYAGTSGTAGLYLHEIYIALKPCFSQDVIVSHYFPFDYGNKWFYKLTDLSSVYIRSIGLGSIRLILRYIELLITFLKILRYFQRHKVKIINYSLTSDLRMEFFFLKFLKRSHKSIIVITCHDVIPFFKSNKINEQQREIIRKKKFYQLADYLILHNKSSELELKNTFNINLSKVIQLPFPVMDLENINLAYVSSNSIFKKQTSFKVGFIGHLRKEKGIDILIQAWDKFYEEDKSAELIIAGNIPSGLTYNFELIINKSIQLFLYFIDDSKYKNLIKQCDLIIIPYTKGTNSGIPSSVISSGTLILTSDIPMFKDMPYLDEKLMFKSGNSDSLAERLGWFYRLSTEARVQLMVSNLNALNKYKKQFSMSYQNGFTNLINTGKP